MSLLIAMFSFSLAMSISPGPVNMVIVSSGASYGVRKTFSFVQVEQLASHYYCYSLV